MNAKRTLANIEKDIADTKDALANVKGGETEVYARIVGYFRSVKNWNPGKKEEFKIRKLFKNPDSSEPEPISGKHAVVGAIVRYDLFARTTCPNCPPIKAFMANATVDGTVIDVDSKLGLKAASERGIVSVPTVVAYDAHGSEVARGHTVQELTSIFS